MSTKILARSAQIDELHEFFISLKYLPRINDAGCYEMVRYFKQYYLGGGGELLGINYKISVKYVE